MTTLVFYDGPTDDLIEIAEEIKEKKNTSAYIVDNYYGYSFAMERFNNLQIRAQEENNEIFIITNLITLLSALCPNPKADPKNDIPYYEVLFYKNKEFIRLYDIYPNIQITNNLEKMYKANYFN